MCIGRKRVVTRRTGNKLHERAGSLQRSSSERNPCALTSLSTLPVVCAYKQLWEATECHRLPLCSTPFGINGTNRLKRLIPSPVDLSCAQRLSASTEQTVFLTRVTPSKTSKVLNAFRHQRNKQRKMSNYTTKLPSKCSTPFGINGTNRTLLCWHTCSTAGAQRLSASTEQTALRSFTSATLTARVLNAFRHQRNKQPATVRNTSCPTACSTPFGINGTNSRNRWSRKYKDNPGAQRLSA